MARVVNEFYVFDDSATGPPGVSPDWDRSEGLSISARGPAGLALNGPRGAPGRSAGSDTVRRPIPRRGPGTRRHCYTPS